jgi:hypothetical protein
MLPAPHHGRSMRVTHHDYAANQILHYRRAARTGIDRRVQTLDTTTS